MSWEGHRGTGPPSTTRLRVTNLLLAERLTDLSLIRSLEFRQSNKFKVKKSISNFNILHIFKRQYTFYWSTDFNEMRKKIVVLYVYMREPHAGMK